MNDSAKIESADKPVFVKERKQDDNRQLKHVGARVLAGLLTYLVVSGLATLIVLQFKLGKRGTFAAIVIGYVSSSQAFLYWRSPNVRRSSRDSHSPSLVWPKN